MPPSPCHNNNNLVNSTPCLLLPCTHWEDANDSPVSQWWGHCGLHQDEVLECRRLKRRPKVSLIVEIRQLTTIPRLFTICMRLTSFKDEASVNLTEWSFSEPLLVRYSAAFEGNNTAQSDNDTMSSMTLCEDKLVTCCVFEPWLVRVHTASKDLSTSLYDEYADPHCWRRKLQGQGLQYEQISQLRTCNPISFEEERQRGSHDEGTWPWRYPSYDWKSPASYRTYTLRASHYRQDEYRGYPL